MPKRAVPFFCLMCLLGLSTLIYGAQTWSYQDASKFIAYLAIAVVASRLKVGLPEITGTVSVNFLFILIGIVELNLGEALAIGCASTLAQTYMSRRKWPKAEQVLFNASSVSFAIGSSYLSYHAGAHGPLLLMFSACVY